MARRRTYRPLDVYLNGRQVGQLQREVSGAISFTYHSAWLNWPQTMPVSLSLPLREDRFVGEPVRAVFENLLPDEEPIRRRVAERLGTSGTDAYSMLAAIGKDCVGALQFLPEGDTPQALDRITGNPISDSEIASILRNLDVTPLGIRSEGTFRLSIAGAQDKTALLQYQGQWTEPTSTTPTTHIFKPTIGKLNNGMDFTDSVENEYLCLRLLEAFGLNVASVEVASFEDQKTLIVERFDRRWTNDGRLLRLPQEDCCQALSIPPTRKYQSEGGPGINDIMTLLRGSNHAKQDRFDFFKANILFWLIGATDGHAKNFSIYLLPGGGFRMTPLYDVLTLQPMVNTRNLSKKEFRLSMHLGKSKHYKVDAIVRRHFIDTGKKSGLSQPSIEKLIDEVKSSAETALQEVREGLPDDFPESLLDTTIKGVFHRLSRL